VKSPNDFHLNIQNILKHCLNLKPELETNHPKENLFSTKLPLPTLNAAHQDFQPEDGYWRGLVWMDQANFGFKGLKNYAFDDEPNELLEKLLRNDKRIMDSAVSIGENSNHVTDEGL